MDVWAVGLVGNLTKPLPYLMLDLNGFDGFVKVLMDSSGKADTEAASELSALLKASNAAVRDDGSVEFKDLSPAAVVNTPPQMVQRIRQLLRDSQARLDWLNDNQKITWNSYNQRKNVLFWLGVSLDAKRVYSPTPIQIAPNPETLLPKDWLKQVKPVTIE